MGLLEKAQERKQTIDQDIITEEIKIEENNITDQVIINENIEKTEKTNQELTQKEEAEKSPTSLL